MKKLITLFSLLFSITAFSQVDLYFGRKSFVGAEIILENGDIKTGFLQDFHTPRFVESDIGFLSGIEKKLKFETKEFKFKEEKTSTVQIIKIEDLKRIVILNTDGSEKLVYDKMKLKTINSQNEVIDVNKTVVLPLEQEGKINLYGINVAFFQNNKYVSSLYLPYIKKPDDEYGYILIDINRINLFNMGKIDDKLQKGLFEATKDCPVFSNALSSRIKALEKEVKESRGEGIKLKNQARKDIKDKAQENFTAMKIDHDYAVQPYENLLDEYAGKCTK
jgi:hypothetical protein